MVERQATAAATTDVEIDAVFHALAHRARRAMLGRLSEHDLTVGELAEPLQMTLAAASKHIKVLERVGLVGQTVAGRQRVCHLQPFPLAPAFNWLRFYEHFWDERLDALESLFTSTTKTSTTKKGNQ